MLKAILVTKATLAARTPAPPLMPQNQGMPVGNPKPIRKPASAKDKDAKAGANEKVCSIEVDQERGQPER